MFGLKQDKIVQEFITSEILADFKAELIVLLKEVLNGSIAFEEKVN